MPRRDDAAAITFEPTRIADLEMLHEWLLRPHVARWWDAPAAFEDLLAEYAAIHCGADSTRAYVVHRDGRPSGFALVYVPLDDPAWWPDETDAGARGIDVFLADAADLGRGIGTRMVGALCEHLFADSTVTRIQVDPARDNARAIRCFARAGFVAQREVATPDGPALLMLRTRTSPPDEGLSRTIPAA